MFAYVDLNALVLGLLFGLVLSTAVVAFLIHAAIHTPQGEDDGMRSTDLGKLSAIARYEGRRAYLHQTGHDIDIEW